MSDASLFTVFSALLVASVIVLLAIGYWARAAEERLAAWAVARMARRLYRRRRFCRREHVNRPPSRGRHAAPKETPND